MVGESGDSTAAVSFDELIRLYRAVLRETGGEYGFVSEGTLHYINRQANLDAWGRLL